MAKKQLSVWRGSLAQYQALGANVSADTIYYIITTPGALTGRCFVGTKEIGVNFKSVATFPTTDIEQGLLYVGPNGEAKFWNGTAWVVVSYPLTTSVTASSTDLEVPSALSVYTYVNTLWSGMGRLLPAVQDVNALKAVTAMQDKDLILVESVGNLYRFDAESTATGDDDKIVVPSASSYSAAGRWIKMFTAVNLTAGNGITISGTHISVNADSEFFEYTSGALTMKATKWAEKLGLVTLDKAGEIVTAKADGTVDVSGVTVGGSALAAEASAKVVATEKAVAGAITTVSGALVGDIAVASSSLNDTITNASSALNAAKMNLAATGSDGQILKVDNNGQGVVTGMYVGGSALAATDAARATNLATEQAVKTAVDNTSSSLQGNIDGKINVIGGGTVADADLGKLMTVTSGGQAAMASVKVGDATLNTSSATRLTLVATEAAVYAAMEEAKENAKLYWTEAE